MVGSDLSRLIEAFDRLATVDFTMGEEWQAVHQVCQEHEGEQAFDWGHALCHRIEGDEWNAGYWYRNAGKSKARGSFAEEWGAMRTELLRQG